MPRVNATGSGRWWRRRPSLPPLLADVRILRRLAWTYFLSSLGFALQGIAFGYLGYGQSGHAIAPVLVVSAFTVPYAAVSLPAGRWAQRLDRRRVLIASNVAKMVLYAGVLVLSLTGELSLLALVATSAAGGVTSAVGYPAWQGILHALTHDHRLDQGNALFSSLSSVANIVGAFAGGAVLAAVGPEPLFGFNVLTY